MSIPNEPRPYFPVTRGMRTGQLQDVRLTDPQDEQVLRYDAATGKWTNATLEEPAFIELVDVEGTWEDGDLIVYNAADGVFVPYQLPEPPSTDKAFTDLTDVEGEWGDGQYIVYDAGTSLFVPATLEVSQTLDDLTDVSTTGANDGDVLTYHAASGTWIDAAPAVQTPNLSRWSATTSGSLLVTTTPTLVPGLITPTLSAGTYLVTGLVRVNYYDSNVTKSVVLRIRWGSSNVVVSQYNSESPAEVIPLPFSAIVTLTSSDTLEVQAYKSSSIDNLSTHLGEATYMHVVRLG